MIEITLPWPPSILFPNRHSGKHWGARNSERRAARETGYLLAKQESVEEWGLPGLIPICFEFRFPSNHRRDSDGLHSAMKAYQDGISEALGVDDARFWPVTLTRGENVAGGAVIMRIGK